MNNADSGAQAGGLVSREIHYDRFWPITARLYAGQDVDKSWSGTMTSGGQLGRDFAKETIIYKQPGFIRYNLHKKIRR